MEFKGDEFIRNLEIEKEKAQLKKQTDALDAEKNRTVIKTPQYFQENSQDHFNDDPVIVDIKKESEQELTNILLEESSEKENKKKYIILTVSLTILFIVTIIIIRLISEDTTDNQMFTDVETIEQDNILGSPNSNEKYQNLIDKKAKQTIQKQLDLDKIVQKEIPLPKTNDKQNTQQPKEETTTDIFGMEVIIKRAPKKEVIEKVDIKPVETIKQPEIKKEIKNEVKKEIIKIIPQVKTISGSYVQVGAFTKTPSKTLLNKIKRYGYTYIIHEMNIKGTLYKKVLIGPYKNRTETLKAMSGIKKDLNKPGAYIMRLK